MNVQLASSLIALVLAAVATGPAFAQADNTNSVTEPDRTIVALASPALASPETTRWTMPRFWRDEPRRRELSARHAEGLTAAELGILYGTSFASGTDEAASASAPTPAP